MIENRDVAEQISKLMLDFGDRLDASILVVQASSTPAEAARYKRVVANIMGEMLLEVMNPIYEKHPDLKPKELD
jgi:hypothetical protein